MEFGDVLIFALAHSQSFHQLINPDFNGGAKMSIAACPCQNKYSVHKSSVPCVCVVTCVFQTWARPKRNHSG